MTATVAEVFLIRQDYPEAALVYTAAVAMAPKEIASHKSTWRLACRIMGNSSRTPGYCFHSSFSNIVSRSLIVNSMRNFTSLDVWR